MSGILIFRLVMTTYAVMVCLWALGQWLDSRARQKRYEATMKAFGRTQP